MTPKGTLNLGVVKAIYSGVNPPKNKELIWFDNNTNQMIHKVFDFPTNAWKPLAGSGNGGGSGNYANIDASNLSVQNVASWHEVLGTPSEGGVWTFPTI